MPSTETLDLCGLKCPLPALLARRAVMRATEGSVIEILADDPLAYIDLPHMCRQEGFEILSQTREENRLRLRVRRA